MLKTSTDHSVELVPAWGDSFSVHFEQTTIMDDGHGHQPKDFEGHSQGWLSSTNGKSGRPPATLNLEVYFINKTFYKLYCWAWNHLSRIVPALTVWASGVILSLVLFGIEMYGKKKRKIIRRLRRQRCPFPAEEEMKTEPKPYHAIGLW